MRPRYVIDTNVLIAASAADPSDLAGIDATPRDPALRLQVWQWLSDFEQSKSRLVLDYNGEIYSEYRNKLGFNDYGTQVVMHKWSTAAVDDVLVEYDVNGDGVLPVALEPVVHDRADRKIVAAALRSHSDFGEGCIAFAGDTDWHGWETELLAHQLILEPIIEEWSRLKYAEKENR
jgi:hypothetical protein